MLVYFYVCRVLLSDLKLVVYEALSSDLKLVVYEALSSYIGFRCLYASMRVG